MALPRRNGQYRRPITAPNPFENNGTQQQPVQQYAQQPTAYQQPQATSQPAPQYTTPVNDNTSYQFSPVQPGAPMMNGSMPTPAMNLYGDQTQYEDPTPSQYPAQAQAIPTDPNGEPPLWAPWYGISFQQAFKRAFQKYAVFNGRASRSEYWWWVLANFIVSIILSSISSTAGDNNSLSKIASTLAVVYSLGTIIPNLSIACRRAHDSNKSGYWVLGYTLAPIIGSVLLVLGFGSAFLGGMSALAGGSNSMATGGASMALIGSLLTIIGCIVSLVVNLSKSDPAGARFDKPTA